MAEKQPSRRAIPLDADGVARLIAEFNSHLEVNSPLQPQPAILRPIQWEEEDLARIRRSVRDSETGIVDIPAHVRDLALYTEVPRDVIQNIALLALGRIAQKLIDAQGALTFRHGTFLRIESNPDRVAEVFRGFQPLDRIVINVWIPGSDLASPPVRRVPAPILDSRVDNTHDDADNER